MSRRLDQWRALAPWERRMLVRLALLLPLIGLGLRVLGFRRFRDLLARLAASVSGQAHTAPDPETHRKAQRLARLVAIAAHHGPYRVTCLRQSLALWWLLRRRGIPAELRIGVRKEAGELQAHAWVESEGVALHDGADLSLRYAAFDGA
ncbi:MAG: lasso peptide biosynthesis B2 protein [Bdellovibrio bacteriovorus]